jgi:chemotaxis protein histidine kinase CheA
MQRAGLAGANRSSNHAGSVAPAHDRAVGQSELEEDVLAVEASEKPGDTIAGIRRTVHTLKAEFGVLNMTAPQKLCHQAETTIDAVIESARPFPVDALLQCIDLLKQFVDRLARDIKAECGDVEPMLQKLRALAENGEAAPATEADAATVVLTVGGEFADSLNEFITEARPHLADAEAAMVALSSEPSNLENINLTFRAFHTIKGVAGFLNLTQLVELAHVAETLLDGARAQRFAFDADDIDLVLASGDMIQQMIHSLEGQRGPLVREWKGLIGKLQAAALRSAEAKNAPADVPASAEAPPVLAKQPTPAVEAPVAIARAVPAAPAAVPATPAPMRTEAVAQKHRIPYQRTILPRGGQDGAAAQMATKGARAIGITVGTRYIHTVTEMIDTGDLAAARDLLAAWIPTID